MTFLPSFLLLRLRLVRVALLGPYIPAGLALVGNGRELPGSVTSNSPDHEKGGRRAQEGGFPVGASARAYVLGKGAGSLSPEAGINTVLLKGAPGSHQEIT